MKILSAEEIRAWDQFTIQHEPTASINLMERAAGTCLDWLERNNYTGKHFNIFCGKGNNGGDGLAIARMLAEGKNSVAVYILEFGHKGTQDFQMNLARLHQYTAISIRFIQSEDNFPVLHSNEIIIDALFGSGLNRGLEGITAKLTEFINRSGAEIIAIDIPSGLFVDRSSKGNIIINAKHTLSFQCYKPAFLVAENAVYIGDVHILDIGLHKDFIDPVSSPYEMTDDTIIHSIYKPRNEFAHKGNFGHAALIAGSTGMMGAATLSASACMRSGVGKLTCYIPRSGYEIMQIAVPEAMAKISGINDHIEEFNPVAKHEAIGIGPGIGLYESHEKLLENIFLTTKHPMVIDADALTMIAKHEHLLLKIPHQSILTPHPKEFERLFGKSANDFDRIQLAIQKAKESDLVIVLKGHHTLIATPGGKAYFNDTGNAGMATGGSGDVLTGILTGLLAQGYSSKEAAIFGVYLHGLAGDIAAEKLSPEAMIARDIIENTGKAFLTVAGKL